MEFENRLRLATNIFEIKIKKLREEYISKNPNYRKEKLDSYVNRKLKGDINFLIGINVSSSMNILSN